MCARRRRGLPARRPERGVVKAVRAWKRGCWAALGAALAACSSDATLAPSSAQDADEPGTIRGQLVVLIADFDDGTADTRYFLRDAKGVEHRLIVNGNIDVAPGSQIRIRGTWRADGIELASYQALREAAGDGIGSQSLPLVDSGPRTSRVLCSAVIAINGGTPNSTVSAVENAFHLGATSANAYFLENSFGKNGLAGATYGPFSYNMTTCDYNGLRDTIRPMIDAMSPVPCEQYAWVFGPKQSTCAWSGLGQVGTRDKPAAHTWYNDSISCVVAVQEPAHNYGLAHSSTISCGTTPFADDLTACTHNEYGDKYDTMGGGCYHMNAWHKLFQSWFGGCNAVSTSSTATFNLHPIETPCDGVQVLRVPFPLGKVREFQSSGGGGAPTSTILTSYYLEFRKAVGFDSKLPTPQVLVRAGGEPVLPNQVNARGLHTWLFDASGSATIPGLTAGQSFTDPAGGLTISVTSINAAYAVVNVQYTAGSGTPYCLDGLNTSFTPPGATTCSGGGGAGGAGGAAGSGGASGKGGASGTGGSSGKGGASGGGGAGAGGTAGAGGSTAGGASGNGGSGGTGGASGSSGSAGAGGSGTAGSSGNGGASGTGATGGSTGTGGAGGSAGLPDASSTGGGAGSGGKGGTGAIDSGARGGAGGAAGNRSTGGAGGAAGAGARSSDGGGQGGAGAVGGGFDHDASTDDGGIDPGNELTVDRSGGACICTVPGGGATSRNGSATLVALPAIAALWRRRRRLG